MGSGIKLEKYRIIALILVNIIRIYHECDGGTEKIHSDDDRLASPGGLPTCAVHFLSFPRVGMGFSQMSKTAETSRDIERRKLASLV